jgi:DNA-binding transcriptional LysR family regulator
MNFTFHQLQIFHKIVQTKSITRAAEELHLTQPALSIQLKNFQSQFEIPLTEITGRQLYVTDFGYEIAAAAEKILEQVYAINYKTMTYKGALTGKLKISVVSTGQYIMPFFLSSFLKQHSGIELKMDVTNKSKVMKSMEQNEVDFALVSVLPDQPKVNTIELAENKLYLIGNSEKSFQKKPYSKSIFEEIPLIYREEGSGTRLVMERYIQKNKLPVQKKMELTSNEAVKQAVIAGLGYSIMPIIGIRNELKNGDLQIIPVQGFPIESKWHLIWLRNKKFSPAAEAYLQFLKKEKQNIIRELF